MHLQVVFLDDQARPHYVEKLLLGHHAMAPCDKRHEQIESAAAELGCVAIGDDDAGVGIQANPARLETHNVTGRMHRFPKSSPGRRRKQR